MTLGRKNIKSVAIIGGGPSGIAALYELLHTLKDGTSIVGEDHKPHLNGGDLLFEDVTLFERNSTTGGTWCKTECGKEDRDPDLPILDGEEDKPHRCFRKFDIPHQVENATFERPFIKKEVDFKSVEYQYQWNSTGVYDGLFTNIPYNLMTYSFTKDLELPLRMLKILQPWEEVSQYLEQVVADNDLAKHIRCSSNVEQVYKKPGSEKWTVTVREVLESGEERWYQQQFDAVVIANGKTVPIIPVLPQLDEFRRSNPQVQVKHCKNITKPHLLNNYNKILFVGSGISTLDLIQYCFPRPDKTKDSIFVARRSAKSDFDWVDYATYSSGIVSKPVIARFLPESNGVEFADGSVESDFDLIILGTGYHKYFPFLDKLEQDTGENYHIFYDHVFSSQDPTLAVVGTIYAAFFFNRAEASSSAIAGVWSGYRELPDAKQLKEQGELSEKYGAWEIKTKFIQFLLDKYGTKGRKNPFDTESRKDVIRDYGEGFRIVGQIFSDLKDGRITHEDVFKQL